MSDTFAPDSVAAPAEDSFTVETNAPEGGSSPTPERDLETEAQQSVPNEEPSDHAATDAASVLNQKKRSLEGRKQTYQQQINELARQRGEQQRAFEAERRTFEEFRAQQTQAPLQAAPESSDPYAPTEDQFETYGQYVQAAARYEGQRAVRAAQQQASQHQEAANRQQWFNQREASHADRLETFRSHNPGFDVAVDREDIDLSTPMIDVIKASEFGPTLMLHMAQNPDDAQRIAALHPVLAYGEMKALEARVSVAHGSTAAFQSVSQAKRPIRPVGSVPSGSADDPSELAFGPEYVARMNKLDRSRRLR